MELNWNRFIPLLMLATCTLSGSARADQVVKTLPGGDGKALLNSSVDPVEGSGAIIRDVDCAKKIGKMTLDNGKPNPEYTRCVHEKIEKMKKKGTTQ